MKKSLISLFLFINCAYCLSAQATTQPLGGIPDANTPLFESMGATLEQIKNILQKFYDDWSGFEATGAEDYKAPTLASTYDIQKITAYNNAIAATYTGTATLPAAQNMTSADLLTLLTTPPSYTVCTGCKDNGILALDDISFQGLSQNLNSIAYDATGNLNLTYITERRQALKSGCLKNGAISNLDALLNGLALPDAQSNTQQCDGGSSLSSVQFTPFTGANNFIKIASGLIQPLQIKSTLPKKAANSTGADPAIKYLASVLTYSARQSVGLSNLYQMLAVRTKPQNGKSPLEVENEMATHRLNTNNTWHSRMETANNLTIQRETLYLLAEMNYQMYQQRLLTERLLATVSVFQLQNLDFAKMFLEQP